MYRSVVTVYMLHHLIRFISDGIAMFEYLKLVVQYCYLNGP